MRSEARTLWKHGRIYALSNLISRAAGLLLLPLYAKLLTPAEFGLYALVVVIVDLFAGLLSAAFGRAMMPVFLAAPEERRPDVIATALLATGAVGLAVAALAWPVARVAAPLILPGADHAPELALGLASMAAITQFEVTLFVLRVQKRSGGFLVACAAKAGLLLAFNLLLVLVFKLGVLGILAGNLAAFSMLALLLTVWQWRRARGRFSAHILGNILRVGGPLVPTVLMDLANTAIERYVLGAFFGTAHVGVYAFGARVSQMLQMFVATPFYQIWVVRRMETGAGGTGDRVFLEIFHAFLLVMATGALVLALMAPELILVLATPDYMGAAPVIALLGLGVVLSGVRLEAEIAILGTQRTGVLPLVAAGSLAGGAVATVALTWWFGLVGAAAGAVVRHLLHLVFMQIAARRMLPDRPLLPYGRLFWLMGLAAVAYGAGLELFGTDVGWRVAAEKLLICAGFVIAVAFTPASGAAIRRRLFANMGRLLARAAP